MTFAIQLPADRYHRLTAVLRRAKYRHNVPNRDFKRTFSPGTVKSASGPSFQTRETSVGRIAVGSGENQSVTRAIELLNLLADSAESLGVRDIARRIGVAPSNV